MPVQKSNPAPTRIAQHPFAGGRKTSSVTKAHQKLVWECMLGTVYARNPLTGAEEYFDYDWDAARTFAMVAECSDLRVCAPAIGSPYEIMNGLRRRRKHGKLALYGIPPAK